MPHPPLPQVKVRVMVGIRFILRFMGGVGGWVVFQKPGLNPVVIVKKKCLV